jgi:hypothetical protein
VRCRSIGTEGSTEAPRPDRGTVAAETAAWASVELIKFFYRR